MKDSKKNISHFLVARGTGSVLYRNALWDWVGVVSNCTMGLSQCCFEMHYGTFFDK